jgi:hypothetical protein
MPRNVRVQMLAVLAAGGLLGYLAPSGWNPFQGAEAAPSTGPTATERSIESRNQGTPCCSESHNAKA